MERRLLLLLLAAGALAACQHDSQDREPLTTSPAPSMSDAVRPRFGAEAPLAAPRPDRRLPERPADAPQRPPAAIPNVNKDPDALSAAYQQAHKQATAPRPPVGAGETQALVSVPLSQIVGAHLGRSSLKVRADDGVQYTISAQAARLDGGKSTAYLVFYRQGMRSPGFLDIRSIKLSNGLFAMFGGGSLESFDVEGRRFGVTLHADTGDGECSAKPKSQVEVWAFAHHDAAHTAQFSISEAFSQTQRAGITLKGSKGQASLVVYEDAPAGSGKISAAIFGAEPAGGLRPVPLDLVERASGKLVSLALRTMPQQRFGLSVSGGQSGTLDVFDLSSGGPKAATVSLDSLVPPDPCGK